VMSNIPLGPFIKQVRERLEGLSHQELCALLIERARETNAAERTSFLGMLRPSQPSTSHETMSQVESFIDRLREGGYFREWSQEEPSRAIGDESWATEMDELFSLAAQDYIRGDYALAAQEYGALLHAFRLEGEGDIFCGPRAAQEMVKTDLDEAKCRYLRALYESTPENERASLVFDELIALANIGSWKIFIRDIESAEEATLSSRELFYEQFEARLRAQPREGQNRLYPREDLRRALLREVVSLRNGAEGLLALSREEGARHPEVFHELLTVLSSQQDRERLLSVARDGMLQIEDVSERALFADKIAPLAASLGDAALSLAAKVQAFRATPTQTRLLQLLASIPREDMHAWATRELEEAKHRVVLPESVATWLSLLRGDTKAALRYLQSASSLGWSRPEHPGRVAFPALLICGCGVIPRRGSSLDELLLSVNLAEDGSIQGTSGSEQICAAVLSKERSAEERRSLLDVVVRLAEKRIRAIISHQHKKAFGRAAQLSVACAEAYQLAGAANEGASLLAALLEEFRRHTPYREEVEKRRIKSSILSATIAEKT
jgi:hypothetical protein